MLHRLAIQALAMALFVVIACPCAAADDAYDETILDGAYRVHDIFALRNGNGEIAVGTRDFNGAGRISSLVNFANRTPLDYEVSGDGRLRWFASSFAPGTVGSIGLGGEIAAFAPAQAAAQDSQVPSGYAAVRLSLAEGAGYVDADFKGTYSYHALLFRGTRWWNVFGAADVNGTSRVRLVRGTSAPFDQAYNVNGNGSVTIGNGGTQAATIIAAGEAVVQVPQIGTGVDALYAAGYDGLAFYLKRGTSAAPFDPIDFQGSYNIVELRVQGNGNVSTRLGRITAGAAGLFYGTLGGSAFDGQAAFFDSGVFTLDGVDDIDATISAGGDFAVVTARGGLVSNGSGEAFLQLWLRVAGGAPTANDSDGDGLSDGAEDDLGTDPSDRDSDNDGVLDNEDDRPLTADNTFTAVLNETALALTEGDPDPAPLSLKLDAKGFPYFTWALSDNADWLRFSESSGIGDAQVNVILETSSLSARAQPYEATITIAAPGMKPVPPITVSVLVRQDSIGLTLTPNELNFAMSENGTLPGPQTARISAAASQDFTWSITTTGSWLNVSPTSGTGPRDVTVSVKANALPTNSGPYSSSLTLASGDEETFSTAFLRVYPDRTPGVPFLAADSVAVVGRSLGLGDEDALLLYSDGADVFAIPFDARAVPRLTRMRMDGPLATLTGPTATAIDAASRTALCIWEEAAGTTSSALITAREIDLETLDLGNAFVIAAAEGNVRAPSLIFDRVRGRFVMSCIANIGDTSVIRVGFFTLDEARDVPFHDVYTEGDSERVVDAAALALNSVTGDALVCWRDLDTSPANNGQGRISGCVARADGSLAAPVTTMNNETHYPDPPAAAYDAARPGWVVTWQEGTRVDSEIEKVTRYSALQLSLAPAHAFEVPMASPFDRGTAANYSAASRRILAATVDANSKINYYQVTPQGNLIAGPTLVGGDATQYAPAAYTTPDGTYHWLIYGEGQDVYAVRLEAGDSDKDDDGLEDDWEIFYGLDPESAEGIDGADGDPDLDLLTNDEEQRMGTNPRLADSDDDGLPDRVEDANRDGIVDPGESGASAPDTDGDGANDAVELFAGTDPQSAGAVPTAGIYGADYGALAPGAPASVRLRVFVAQAGTFRLSLNPLLTDSWVPPTAWAAVAEGGTERAFAAGTHLINVSVTPPGAVTPLNSHGVFRFVFAGTGVTSERTLELVCDARPASGLSANAERALAEMYAPIIRLSSGESFSVTPVGLTAAKSALLPDGVRSLTRNLGLDGPALLPFADAVLDETGNTPAQWYTAYDAAAPQYPAEIYYTVTSLSGPTEAEFAPPPGVVLQFYLHFYADDWEPGAGTAHRHEGDWEVMQITFADGPVPRFATVGQQLERARAGLATGTAVAAWDDVEKHTDGRPIVYVGRGGHALYLSPGGERVGNAFDAHDGLGPWCVPRVGGDGAPVALGYTPEVPYALTSLSRLGAAASPGWLRYAGHWGQRSSPQSPNAEPVPGAADGPRGPVFLGTGDVHSVWVDPFAWEQSAPPTPLVTQTSLRARFLDAPAGASAYLLDPRGLAWRVPLNADGSIQRDLPVGSYRLALLRALPDGGEALEAVVQGLSGEGRRAEIVLVDRAVNELGTFERAEGTNRYEGPANWAVLDLDGDGIRDGQDTDINNSGAPGMLELDALGDGWPDAYQFADVDGDDIPGEWDDDDDGDGLPDAEDDDDNGNGIPDSMEMPDLDDDGVPDPYDVDLDNDTFTNAAELAAGSDPRHPYDTPTRRICDVDGDGEVDAADAQRVINGALGRASRTVWMDANEDGQIQALDIATCIRIILETRN